MALLSRSSLRGSVRRNPDEPSDDDGLAPPMKRQRTAEEKSHRRRRSSPDCLDTTTLDVTQSTDKARPTKPPLKAARRRTSTRRNRRPSASSIGTIASGGRVATEDSLLNGNDAVKAPGGQPDRETTDNASTLRGARESPDPLDMLSQSTNDACDKMRPRVSSGVAQLDHKPAESQSTKRGTRRSDHESADAKAVGRQSSHPEETRSVDTSRSQQKRKSDQLGGEPLAPGRADGRRSLRSADSGSRCKSELAQYFYNYEQLISLEGPKPEFLAANTTITLVDDLPEPLPLPSTPDPTPFGNPLRQLHDCEVIELSEPALRSSGVDPLGEELYFRAHRKFERQEKQLRNIERDRAQHEKQQVERLLDELRGHDWLRVMGLTGVHESEKKLYEPKRQILIQELVALVNKFQVWKDEERRRKLAKDKPLPTADGETDSRRSRKRSRPAEDVDAESSPLSETPSTPDPNDVDAWAARQLQEEARSASAAKRRKSVSEKPKSGEDDAAKNNAGAGKRQKTLLEYLASDTAPTSHHTSSSDKPSTPSLDDTERSACPPGSGWGRAIHRRAHLFDQPLPEIEAREFAPPAEFLTEEAIQASQRQRRRLKRQSAAG